MSTAIDTRLDLDIIEALDEEGKPPLLHCYCARCIEAEPEVWAMCGFKKRPTAGFVDVREGDKCVVCLDVMYEPCSRCGA